jgi:hypothetical protein
MKSAFGRPAQRRHNEMPRDLRGLATRGIAA